MTQQERPGPPRPFWAARPSWLPPVWPPAIALAFLQVVVTSAIQRHQPERVSLDALGYVLLLAGPVMLLFRRRYPVAVAAGTAAVTLLYVALGYAYGPVFASLVVAVFSAVAAGHRKAVLIIAAGVLAGHALAGQWLYRWLPPSGDHRVPWTQLSGAAAWLLAVLAAAELFRVRREQIARDRKARAEAEQRQVDEERMRIARELHDVLAHSISLINVQAGVALALMDERPEQARTALTTIKAASKEALGEVRQVLSTLRAPGEAPRSPAPGLDRLPELLEQAASAGLHVEIAVEGERAPLPPGADLAAFRIVQEALTNIVRHSGSRTARVRLEFRPDRVRVRVDDDGPAVAGGESGGGNGLVGMRERAAALGGTAEAGPRPEGGFRVSADLPLTAAEPPLPTGREPRPDRPPARPAPDDRPEAPGAPQAGDHREPAGHDGPAPGPSGHDGPDPRPSRHDDPNPGPSRHDDLDPRPSGHAGPDPRPSGHAGPDPRPSRRDDPNPRPSGHGPGGTVRTSTAEERR
ncbi:histidine kinase [Streptomyces sp. CA-111067]|uniref:sensor histidine kinase n=1 Tax=Streptomyces sp. CA-111067 TaxID=3240046 RepID=UPI003D962949